MNRYFRTVYLLLSLLLIISLLVVPSAALSPKINDKASLFSGQELEELEKSAAELSERLQLDVVIVTTDENDGKTSRQYADDFYDKNGYGYGKNADGILMLINMEDREVYISTCGIAIKYFTDDRINSILDKLYTKLGDGYFYDASVTFINEVEHWVNTGIPHNQYSVDENNISSPGNNYDAANSYISVRKELTMQQKLLIFLLISLAAGGISVGVMAAFNRGLPGTGRNTYLKNDSFSLTDRYDHHVNTNVTHTIIQTSSSGSGRSTTHSSSSGRTHGGGGRKF
ncbi:MAG: TPM domain-containing protein [Bacillota bacterium]